MFNCMRQHCFCENIIKQKFEYVKIYIDHSLEIRFYFLLYKNLIKILKNYTRYSDFIRLRFFIYLILTLANNTAIRNYL